MAELTSKTSPDVFGTKAGFNSCKLESAKGSTGVSPLCPQCGSKKLWRDGLRYEMFGDQIQRWLCRDCGLRFSDSNDVRKAKKAVETVAMIETKSLKSPEDKVVTCQICVKETKNLVAEQQIVKVPQKSEMDLKGAIVEFIWQLKKENKSEDTIRAYDYALKQIVGIGINLFDPESFQEKMPTQKQWTDTRKYNLTKAYRCFLNHHNIEAKLTKYKPKRSIPYIPPEKYLEDLIACSSQMLASYQQTLKETGARPGEIWKSEWDDLDIAGKRFTISHPEKGCNPRIINISDRLIQMLLTLPRQQKRIFTYKSRGFIGKLFRLTRQRAIRKFGNLELRKIKPYTYRYWRATFEYHKTHDFGAVMVLLGHNSLKYVLLYAQLSECYFGDRGYLCKEAFTRQEAMQLIEQGFEFVLTDKEGISLFRKLK